MSFVGRSKLAPDPEQPIVLSSPFTFLFKWIVPFLYLAFGGFLLVGPAFIPVQVNSRTASQPSEFGGYYLGVIVLLSATGLFIWWNFLGLKKVAIHGQFLRVSNYRYETDIPLSRVQGATKTGNWLCSLTWPPYRVVVSLRETTAFGAQVVVFIPGYYVNDVLRDLERALEINRSRLK